ncbi:4-alpha-glucanotransferase [soil metagenome]
MAAPGDGRQELAADSVFAARRAGVLLHVASLPGDSPIGTLGAEARRFIDWLADAGFSIWQMLPINPGDSPYHSVSTHAGDPRLLDPQSDDPGTGAEYENFCKAQAYWLDEYALFTALSESLGGRVWRNWPAALRDREPAALERVRRTHAVAIEQARQAQYRFAIQWGSLRAYARERGVLLFGDLPVFVSLDSVDVWAHRDYFKLEADGRPRVVSGVPPDYFSADGQRWGNPLYDWEQLACDRFGWWVDRVATQLARFDVLRIDHFRGLQASWEIPADSPTAKDGRWVDVPGRALFRVIRARCGSGRVVAEDLGTITPEVLALRDEFGIPGMLVLQFGFDEAPGNPYLPHRHAAHAVVYTGTHDNDTTVGWWRGADRCTRRRVCDYFDREQPVMPDLLIRACYASVARFAVVPMQDLLGLDSEARMNTPGTTGANWNWRFRWNELPPGLAAEQRRLLAIYERLNR